MVTASFIPQGKTLSHVIPLPLLTWRGWPFVQIGRWEASDGEEDILMLWLGAGEPPY